MKTVQQYATPVVHACTRTATCALGIDPVVYCRNAFHVLMIPTWVGSIRRSAPQCMERHNQGGGGRVQRSLRALQAPTTYSTAVSVSVRAKSRKARERQSLKEVESVSERRVEALCGLLR